MRKGSILTTASPCDTDFTDKSMQTIGDWRERDRVLCDNFPDCQRINVPEDISCCRTIARQMAQRISHSRLPVAEAVQQERRHFLTTPANVNKFWVKRNGKWQVVSGKENVVDDIAAFALVILDAKTSDKPSKPKAMPEALRKQVIERVSAEIRENSSHHPKNLHKR